MKKPLYSISTMDHVVFIGIFIGMNIGANISFDNSVHSKAKSKSKVRSLSSFTSRLCPKDEHNSKNKYGQNERKIAIQLVNSTCKKIGFSSEN